MEGAIIRKAAQSTRVSTDTDFTTQGVVVVTVLTNYLINLHYLVLFLCDNTAGSVLKGYNLIGNLIAFL